MQITLPEVSDVYRDLRAIASDWRTDCPALSWSDGRGVVTASLPRQCVADCSASGAVDESVAHWVAKVKFELHPHYSDLAAEVRATLAEYGAWDAEELADDTQNLHRLLWVACGDVSEDLPEEAFLDVRLQVFSDGGFSLRTGNASYDQSHRGFWGASSISGFETDAELKELAQTLISEADDSAADADCD